MLLDIYLLFIDNLYIFIKTSAMLRKRISLIAAVIAALIVLLMLYIQDNLTGTVVTSGEYSQIELPENDTAFGGIFAIPYIDDSLPHYQYRRVEDSLKRIRQNKDLENKSPYHNGRTIGQFGISSIPKSFKIESPFEKASKDSLYIKLTDSLSIARGEIEMKGDQRSLEAFDQKADSIENTYFTKQNSIANSSNPFAGVDKLYYLTLSGYQLKDFDTKFYINNGTYNLACVKWKDVRGNNGLVRTGHYENKPIQVRYAEDSKMILIPVSQKIYLFFSIFLTIFPFIMIFFLTYFFVGLPAQILYNISKNRAFTEYNIKNLNIITVSCLVYGLLNILMPYFFRLIFINKIPPEFTMQPFINTVINNISTLFIALALFIITKAFKRGYKLQQEQDLTI